MPHIKTVLRIAGATLVVLFMAFMPAKLEREPQRATITQERETNGIVVSVWHIVGFKPYSGSLGSWIEKQAHCVEAANFGVFFDVSAITLDECATKLARGEQAHVYSFPLGWGCAEQFIELAERPGLKAEFANAGNYGGSCYALPFAVSAYAKVKNENVSGAGKQITTYPIAAACGGGAETSYEPEADFKSGKYPLALGDLRLAGDCSRQLTAGKGFGFSFGFVTEFTDLVQLVGISASAGQEHVKWANMLLDRLVAEPAQSGLPAMGVIPVAQLQTEPEIAPELRPFFEAVYVVPNAFAYNQQADALKAAAIRVLEGEQGAKGEFEERMKQLVVQGQIQ